MITGGFAKLSAMFMYAARMLEWGKKRQGRKYLKGAIIGITLSLIPLMIVLMVVDGMIDGITSRYIECSSGSIQILTPNQLPPQQAAAINSLPEVKALYREIDGVGLAIHGNKVSGVQIRAIDAAFFDYHKTRDLLRVVAGTTTLSSAREVILGKALALTLGASLGDIVAIATHSADSEAGSGVSPLRVTGIVSTGYQELDALWAFIDVNAGNQMLNSRDRRSFVSIMIDEPTKNSDRIVRQLRQSIPFSMYTWKDLNRSVFQSFATTRWLLLLIMTFAVAVASMNVASSIGMYALERRLEIATLLSFGVKPLMILGSFVLCGLLVGLIGTIAGLSLGLLISWRINEVISGLQWLINNIANIISFASSGSAASGITLLNPAYYLERIPFKLNPEGILVIGLASMILSTLAALLPARNASSRMPSELIRRT